MILSSPDPIWPERFLEEAERLSKIFGRQALYIHHIGSTSIPGLIAEPIIDIMPVVRDITAVATLYPLLR